MTGPLELTLEALSDPRAFLPLIVLTAALAAWIAFGPAREPRRAGYEPPLPAPDRDAVSRLRGAMDRGECAPFVRAAYERLDRAVLARTGRPLGELPRRSAAARRAGLPDPREVARLRQRLDALELWAERLDSRRGLRRDFWRTEPASRRQLTSRLPALLASVDRQVERLSSSGP
jgi:hypothetical protein